MTGGAVTGRLTTPDGWPVGGGTLTAVDGAGGQGARTVSGDDGHFLLDGLAPGAYTLVVAAPGHDPAARTITVADGRITPLGVVPLARAGGTVLPAPGTWDIDPQHSSIRVSALHLGMSRIHGRLRRFAGQIVVADPLEGSSVEVTMDPAGVDSDDPDRDAHLRSADFLDVARHPEIRYKSEGLRRLDGEHWTLEGVLTLKDVSAPVPLHVVYRGTGPDLFGGVRAAFSASAEISRDDFAISWNQSVLAGVLAVGRTLRIEIDIQACRS
ncbi:YceI family protein [Pseudonocardia nigra]|uniref:YceI family protein n=1 Tax=Pseudonocardia nigra TaxID=1921578 RepID=UPI001C5FD6EA|nr:YceI family protein [Pseudonocardia nigra]